MVTGRLLGVLALLGGCAASHLGDEPLQGAGEPPAMRSGSAGSAAPQDPGTAADSDRARTDTYDVEAADGFCGVAADNSLLAAFRDDALYIHTAGGEERRVHTFETQVDSPNRGSSVQRSGEYLLASRLGSPRYIGEGPHARVLLDRRGEVQWARAWGEGGPRIDWLTPGGFAVGSDATGELFLGVRGGEEHYLPEGFGPSGHSDDDWLFGRFYGGDTLEPPLLLYDIERGELRPLSGTPVEHRGLDVRIVDGVVIYVEGEGPDVRLVIEAPGRRMDHPLPPAQARLGMLHGDRHTVLLDGDRPVAALDRRGFTLELLSVEPPPEPAQWSSVGDHFAAKSLEGGLPRWIYGFDAADGRAHLRAVPDLPEGHNIFHPICAPTYSAGIFQRGRDLHVALRTGTAGPVRMHQLALHGNDDAYRALGAPLYRASEARAVEHGDTLAIVALDAQDRYCAEAHEQAPEDEPQALVGASLQLLREGGAGFELDSRDYTWESGMDRIQFRLSDDGRCALVMRPGERARLVDLGSGEVRRPGAPDDQLHLLR